MRFPRFLKQESPLRSLLAPFRARVQALKDLASLGQHRVLEHAGAARSLTLHATQPLSVPPNGRHAILVRDVLAGTYRIEIRHTDRAVSQRRKGLFVGVALAGKKGTPALARQLRINHGEDIGPFFYIGGGRTRGGATVQIQDIEVPAPAKWVRFELRSTMSRYINIDSFSISKAPEKVSLARSSSSLARMRSDAEFLLYANIDVNVIDGSSVWLSSMANILARLGKTILLLRTNPKNDYILSNLENPANIELIAPRDLARDELLPEDAAAVIRALDARAPRLRLVVVRGLDASVRLLQSRQFKSCSASYLTDFYQIVDGTLIIPKERAASVQIVAKQATLLLAQTSPIVTKLESLAGEAIRTLEFPPPIPDWITPTLPETRPEGAPIRIGYAGKISPTWGVCELLEWSQKLQRSGLNVELHVAANKISDPTGSGAKFRAKIRALLAAAHARHYSDLNRKSAIELMGSMDYVWCYRPSALEDNTLELSTKLVEMAASGARCICYPSETNKRLLGADYPYFVKSANEFETVLRTPQRADTTPVAARIAAAHSMTTAATRLAAAVPGERRNGPTIGFAGHDFKFLDAYISFLKAAGYPVLRDLWEWGGPSDLEWSRRCLESSDILFCEWGLANAVWYSQQNVQNKPLFVRIHLQEINPRARRFGPQIRIDRVTKVIFVSGRVRDEAIRLWNWPIEKTAVVPNFVLDDEFTIPLSAPTRENSVSLGLLGIIPERKRLDRAVELLDMLVRDGIDAHLRVKGDRPENVPYMTAPGRVAELEYYKRIYARIEKDHRLRDRVVFEPFGHDVAQWYRDIDFVLSSSDFESFHYALADGVLSGCFPLVWPWEEAATIYPPSWLVTDSTAAARVAEIVQMSDEQKRELREANRSAIVSRYGRSRVFGMLGRELGLEDSAVLDQLAGHAPSSRAS